MKSTKYLKSNVSQRQEYMGAPEKETLKYRHSILIVDDEESILNAFRRILADEDYDVHTAGNGK